MGATAAAREAAAVARSVRPQLAGIGRDTAKSSGG
jgi:hypothetical protein